MKPGKWQDRQDVVVAIDVTPDDLIGCSVSVSGQLASFLAGMEQVERDTVIAHISGSVSIYLHSCPELVAEATAKQVRN